MMSAFNRHYFEKGNGEGVQKNLRRILKPLPDATPSTQIRNGMFVEHPRVTALMALREPDLLDACRMVGQDELLLRRTLQPGSTESERMGAPDLPYLVFPVFQ